MKLNKTTICIIVIILFHAVGLVGFLVPDLRSSFIKLVPFHLLLMLGVVAVDHDGKEGRFWLLALIIFLAGFTAEWIGVHKHWIFGDYDYGRTLGAKVFDIPLTIGVNWFVLVYCTGVLMERTRLKSLAARVIVGAVVLVLLDLLIEPVAIRFDYWAWAGGHPPLKNYLGWLGASVLFLYVFELFKLGRQSIVPVVLLVVQFVFFGVLQLVV